MLDAEKEMLIKAGTGVIRISDKKDNEDYKEKHQYLVSILKKLGLEHVHNYTDLWAWYNDYNAKELGTYRSRREFIQQLFEPLLNTIHNSEESGLNLISFVPTGWDKIDDEIIRMKEVLISAEKSLDYQSVGLYSRELLITLSQLVFDKTKHVSTDGTDIGAADSKRMLDAYIDYCMHEKCKVREVKFVKAAVDLANELTHHRTATAMDAELCYNAILSTVHIIRTLSKYSS